MNAIVKKSISKFAEHMNKGAEHLHVACKIYADAVANDHTAAYEFEAAFPLFTQTSWDRMRLVGAGALHCKALTLSDRMVNKVIRLSYADQEAIFIDKIEVVVKDKIVKKNVATLKPEEAKQVFDKDMKPRTVEQQKQFISWKKVDNKKVVPYHINGKTLVVNRACVISLKELRQAVAKMG